MKVEIRPYEEGDISAVRDFNRRLDAAEVDFWQRLPETAASRVLPRFDGRRIYQEYFLAVEGSCVRGGYTLNRQEVSFAGEILSVASCVEPVSEGTIDAAYALVGVQLIRDAVRRSPIIYGLGIGGFDQPMARLFRALGWSLKAVPFYFRVLRARRFFRNMNRFRGTRLAELAMDAAAVSGIGWAGSRIASSILAWRGRRQGPTTIEVVESFGDWADELWQATNRQFSMVAVRDRHVLNAVYPPEDESIFRLRVGQGGRLAGWVVVSDRKRKRHRYWGNMRVGTIMDCLALPDEADRVIGAAGQMLEQRGVDIIVSNQSHVEWCAALRRGGFLRGPSECIFAASRALAGKLDRLDPEWREIHVPRDGRPR